MIVSSLDNISGGLLCSYDWKLQQVSKESQCSRGNLKSQFLEGSNDKAEPILVGKVGGWTWSSQSGSCRKGTFRHNEDLYFLVCLRDLKLDAGSLRIRQFWMLKSSFLLFLSVYFVVCLRALTFDAGLFWFQTVLKTEIGRFLVNVYLSVGPRDLTLDACWLLSKVIAEIETSCVP